MSIWLKLASGLNVSEVGEIDLVEHNLSFLDIKCKCESLIFLGNKGKILLNLVMASCPYGIHCKIISWIQPLEPVVKLYLLLWFCYLSFLYEECFLFSSFLPASELEFTVLLSSELSCNCPCFHCNSRAHLFTLSSL